MKKILMPVFALVLLAGCGAEKNTSMQDAIDNNAEQAEQLDVFATIYPLGYFAERIGGEWVNVQSIYPPGSNAHTFEPTQHDMMALAEADIMFYIGLGMEGFVDSAKESLKGENVEFIATAEEIPDSELGEGHSHEEETEQRRQEPEESEEHSHDHEHAEGTEEHAHGTVDPHVWLSPVLSQNLAESIKNALIKKNPENAAVFRANFEELIEELEALNQSFKNVTDGAGQNAFFVSHDAFGYIANTYGLEQVAVAGLNSEDESSQKELTTIVDLAREKDIQYIAFEQNVSTKLAGVIQEEIGAEAVQLHNLSVLTQEDIENEETYFTLMEKNLAVFEKILN